MAKHSDDGTNGDAVVDAAARANALDCYLAARLAPRGARRDLIRTCCIRGRDGTHCRRCERTSGRRDAPAVVGATRSRRSTLAAKQPGTRSPMLRARRSFNMRCR